MGVLQKSWDFFRLMVLMTPMTKMQCKPHRNQYLLRVLQRQTRAQELGCSYRYSRFSFIIPGTHPLGPEILLRISIHMKIQPSGKTSKHPNGTKKKPKKKPAVIMVIYSWDCSPKISKEKVTVSWSQHHKLFPQPFTLVMNTQLNYFLS